MWFGILLNPTLLKATIRYVKPVASGIGDGSSWTNATTDLQAMINASVANDEIWVAAGTYKPTRDVSGNATPANNRNKTFYIKRNIKVYGGFVGTETVLTDRNPSTNLTILSGDFNNNDVIMGAGATLAITNNSENAYHVVIVDGTSAAGTINTTCVIDGFTITKGNMDASYICGAGMYINGAVSGASCNPTINNCTFSYNDAILGGGVECNGRSGEASPFITNCIFDRNRGTAANGALNINGSNSGICSPTIDHCTFTNNSAGPHEGGAMYIQVVSGGVAIPTISNCIFDNNAAGDYGGAIFNHGTASPNISNCIFTRNYSANQGGAIIYYGAGNQTSTLTNCVFENNTAVNYGGANFVQASSGNTINLTLTNCTFMNNNAPTGSAFYSNSTGNTTTIKNSIFFGTNAATLISKSAGTITPTYSLFKEGATNFTASATNIITSFSPFATYTTLIGADNTWFTTDDGAQLTLCSSAINAGTNTGAPTTDILGNAIYSTTKDMGAYEYQSDACPVYTGTSTCQTVTLSSVTGNQWINILNSNGLVAAINPNGINLGTVTAEISDANNTVARNDAKFLSKSVTFSSSLYPNSATMPSNYSLRLYYNDAELAEYNNTVGSTAVISDMNIAWISGGSACTLNNYSGTASGVINSADITDGEFGTGNNGFYLQFNLNHFTIFGATTSGAVAFPIKMLSFSAENKGYQNLLYWATETEINNDHFEIERGSDAIHFEKIGDTKGAGNSTTALNYEFIDATPLNSTNFYRLKQVDINGTYSYSSVVEVKLDILNGVAIFPNPVQNELLIKAEQTHQEIKITDEMGKVIFYSNIVPNKVDASTWNRGIYFVLIGNKSFKVIKE
jgi:hypothetical protein